MLASKKKTPQSESQEIILRVDSDPHSGNTPPVAVVVQNKPPIPKRPARPPPKPKVVLQQAAPPRPLTPIIPPPPPKKSLYDNTEYPSTGRDVHFAPQQSNWATIQDRQLNYHSHFDTDAINKRRRNAYRKALKEEREYENIRRAENEGEMKGELRGLEEADTIDYKDAMTRMGREKEYKQFRKERHAQIKAQSKKNHERRQFLKQGQPKIMVPRDEGNTDDPVEKRINEEDYLKKEQRAYAKINKKYKDIIKKYQPKN